MTKLNATGYVYHDLARPVRRLCPRNEPFARGQVMQESAGSEAAAAGRFYDRLRASGLSSSALAYGDAYIGQECTLTADEIGDFARRAGIVAGTSVLDIGSGTGGPACYLARNLGCRVLGVDVSVVGHAQAETRAHESGLSHLVKFRYGDIHALEFPAATFDFTISLDSWCHIPHRAALLQRCAQLLRPGGRIAFYDHVERQPLPDEQRRLFCEWWRFAGLETPQSYIDALEAAGFELLFREDTSAYVVRFYTRVLEGYRSERARFEAARGHERYQEGLERLEMSQQLASTGVLGQFGCIAVKPLG